MEKMIKSIFIPGIKILNRLKYAAQIFLMGVC